MNIKTIIGFVYVLSEELNEMTELWISDWVMRRTMEDQARAIRWSWILLTAPEDLDFNDDYQHV